MSITYKIAEKTCFFLGKHANGLIKKQMYRCFLNPKEVSLLPKYMYHKFAVNKVDYRGFKVFIIRNRDVKKRNNKAVLFLAGGGGLLGPMGIHFDTAPGLEDGKNRNIRKAMEAHDPLLNIKMNDLIAKFWAKNVPLDSPDINPAHIDYHNFPKVMLLYGTHEVFYPHVLTLIAKMEQEHADVMCVEKEMCHDWALCSFFPEGKEAIDRMVSYILDIG